MFLKTRLIWACIILVSVAFSGHGQPDNGAISQVEFSDWYDKAIGLEASELMYAPVVKMSRKSFSTHRFFADKTWLEGSIAYNGQSYHSVPILFDIEQQQVILKHPQEFRSDGILVDMSKLERFEVSGHHFERVPVSGDARFYDILYAGESVTFVSRRNKISKTETNEVVYQDNSTFYLVGEEKLIPVKRTSHVIKAYPEYKNIIKEITSSANLKVKLSDEQLTVDFMQALDERMN